MMQCSDQDVYLHILHVIFSFTCVRKFINALFFLFIFDSRSWSKFRLEPRCTWILILGTYHCNTWGCSNHRRFIRNYDFCVFWVYPLNEGPPIIGGSYITFFNKSFSGFGTSNVNVTYCNWRIYPLYITFFNKNFSGFGT